MSPYGKIMKDPTKTDKFPDGTLPAGLSPLLTQDDDPRETAEWLDALDYVISTAGPATRRLSSHPLKAT